MTESYYHKRVKDALYTFGKENPKKYINAFQGAKNPIHITHPQAAKRKLIPFRYEPDVYYIRKNKNKIIFEVLDTELKNSAAIIADIIQCIFCGNVDFVMFIIPINDLTEENRIFDICDIVDGALEYLGANKKLMPKSYSVYYILKKEAKSLQKVKRILHYWSAKHGW